MKKIFVWFLVLMLVLPVASLGEGSVIIDQVKGENADFAFPEDAKLLEVYFPKINGCDAAYVRYGEYSILIDCAGQQWRATEELLNKLGVTQLTYALNTHPDADHIGGFNHVLKKIPAKEFLLGFPEDYPEGDSLRFKVYEDLHKLDIPFRRVQEGDVLAFGDVKVTVMQRTEKELKRVNNMALLLMITLGERSIFFTGDIQADSQRSLAGLEDPSVIKADILKAPHHAYKSMNADFLDTVAPELVIITSGRSTAEGAKQLKEKKINHYYCEQGILRLATDGTVWTVERLK